MFKLKSIENNLEKTNINIDDQGRIGIKDIDPTAQLDINGTLRVRSLENQELLKDKKPVDLSPLVSDKEGNILSLPNYNYKLKDHLIIPIVRTGGAEFHDENKTLKVEKLFSPWGGANISKDRHLVEIKLLFNKEGLTSSAHINYMFKKLQIVSRSGGDGEFKFENNDTVFTSSSFHFKMEIVENGKDQDVLMEFNSTVGWINMWYFITVYKG